MIYWLPNRKKFSKREFARETKYSVKGVKMHQIAPGIYIEDTFAGVTLGALIQPHGTVMVDAPLRAEDARSWRSSLTNLLSLAFISIVSSISRFFIIWFNKYDEFTNLFDLRGFPSKPYSTNFHIILSKFAVFDTFKAFLSFLKGTGGRKKGT